MKKSKNIAVRSAETLWRIVLLPLNVYLLAGIGIILLFLRGSEINRQFTPRYFEYVKEVFSVTGH